MQPNTPDNQNSNVVVPAPFVSDGAPGPQPAAFMNQPTVTAPGTGAMGVPRRRPFKLIAIVIVVLVVAGLAVTGGYYVKAKQQKQSEANALKVAKQFVADLNAGDSTKAYALTTPAVHTKQTIKQFTASLGDLKATAPKYLSEQIWFDGQRAQYFLHEDGLPPTIAGATTGTFTIVLAKDGPTSWKVDTVTIE